MVEFLLLEKKDFYVDMIRDYVNTHTHTHTHTPLSEIKGVVSVVCCTYRKYITFQFVTSLNVTP